MTLLASADAGRMLLVSLLLATAARFALSPVFGNRFVFITYYPVIMLVAAVGGWRWGALATVISGLLAYACFFGDWRLPPDELSALCVFLACNVVMVFLVDRVQAIRRAAEQAAAEARGREQSAQRELAELREARAALRDNEERLRYALLGAGAGMWDWEIPSGRIVWDEPYYQLWGIDPATTPSYENWISFIVPEDRDAAARDVQEVLTSKRTDFSTEFRIQHPKRGVRWLRSMGYTTYASDGTPLRMTGVTVDITSRKEAEIKAEELGRQRQLALTAARMGWWHYDPGSGIVSGDTRLMEIFEVQELPLNVEIFFRHMHPEDVGRVRAAVADAVNPAVARPFLIEYRILHSDGSVRWIEAHGVASFEGEGEARRAKSFVGTVTDITERKQSEAALRASVELSYNIISSMQDGFSILDVSGVQIEANPSLCAMTGFPREELVGQRPPYPYWPPEEYERIQAALEKTLAGDFNNFELVFMRKNGERFPVIVSPFAIRNAKGEPISYAATVKDITERLRGENALRESEERLRFSLQGANAGLWDWDVPTGRVVWDENYYKLWGLDRSVEPNFDNWIASVLPEDREESLGMISNFLEKKTAAIRMEFRINHPRLGVRWLQSMGYTTYADDGTPLRMTGINIDITERRLMEAELKASRDELERRVEERTAELREAGRAIAESEERFRQVTTAIDQVFWLSDAEKNQILYISPGYERIWGRSGDLLITSPWNWIDAIHPEDRQRVFEAATTKQAAGTYDEEYRIIRPDGSERWIRDRAFPIRDSRGKITRIAGVADDITERKKLQRDLISAIEREQERIGRDLHDGLCQILTGAKFKTALLGQKISSGKPESASGEAGAIEILLDEAMNQARGMAQGLNPVQARPGGLLEALTQLAATMDSPGGPHCTFTIMDGVEIADPITAVQLYRIAQEAVQNAVKHSRACNIRITLEHRDRATILGITDDGCGFPVIEEKQTGGRGLFNMKSRASAIGGHLEINSQPGRGTTVTCRVNLSRPSPQEHA